MGKKLFLFVFAIVANTSLSYSQKVQTYQGTQAFNTMYGAISGTEKYSYYVDDNGKKYRQGTYSFSGSKDFRTSDTQIKGTYTLNTTFAKDKLNGTYTASGSFIGKTWSYITGWKSYSGSTKLTAVFANGKPNGTFTALYQGQMEFSGTATMKNGKFVGAYKYFGPGDDNSLWKMSGQLTADGKLTGNWIVEDLIADWHKSYTFLNDVLIADGRMTPQLQKIAKQYAEGKISKEAIEKKGYIIRTDKSLPLANFTNYLLFVNYGSEDAFGLDKLGGYDFRDFSAKSYTEIVQLNTISDEGFNLILKEIRKTQQYNAVYYETFDCRGYECQTFCNSELKYDESSDAYYMLCGEKFNELYGFFHETYSSALEGVTGIYVTKKQYETLVAVKDSIVIASSHDFAEIFNGYGKQIYELGKLYIVYRNDSIDLLGQLPYNRSYNNIELLCNNSSNQYDQYIQRLKSSTYAIRYNKDSSYIIDAESYQKCAWKNELAIWKQFNNALHSASLKYDSLSLIIHNLDNELNSATISGVRASIINQSFARIANGSKDNFQSVYNNIIEAQQLVKEAETIEKMHNYIIENVPDKLLKNYKKEYKKVSSIRATDTSISPEQYKSLFTNISNMQKNIVAYSEQLQGAEKINSVIGEKCGKTYSDILKPWSAKYKTCTTLTNDLKNCLTNVRDVQLIGQKLLNYIDSRQHCDNEYIVILNMCGKQYGDVAKPYQAKVKGLTFVPDMTNAETLEKDIATLTEYSAYQDELKQYLQNREKVEQLNQSVTEKIGKAKNVKKLYGVFYKSLPIVWSVDGDNFKTIKETIFVLQKVEANLQSNGAESYDVQLKKAKTADDFKKVLNL